MLCLMVEFRRELLASAIASRHRSVYIYVDECIPFARLWRPGGRGRVTIPAGGCSALRPHTQRRDAVTDRTVHRQVRPPATRQLGSHFRARVLHASAVQRQPKHDCVAWPLCCGRWSNEPVGVAAALRPACRLQAG